MIVDAESARLYFEAARWPDGPICPTCGEARRIWSDKRRPGFYRCNRHIGVFTVRTGTIFERSKIPLHKWIHALDLCTTTNGKISSVWLSDQIGISQKSAWYMLKRLREACGPDMSIISIEMAIMRILLLTS